LLGTCFGGCWTAGPCSFVRARACAPCACRAVAGAWTWPPAQRGGAGVAAHGVGSTGQARSGDGNAGSAPPRTIALHDGAAGGAGRSLGRQARPSYRTGPGIADAAAQRRTGRGRHRSGRRVARGAAPRAGRLWPELQIARLTRWRIESSSADKDLVPRALVFGAQGPVSPKIISQKSGL